MAIIIPSKNIYEINNQKVVDNEVDRADMDAKNASIIKETKEFYNKQITANPYTEPEQSEYSADYYLDALGPLRNIYAAISYVRAVPKYDSVEIKIPTHGENWAVLKVLDGVNKDGEANIKYSLKGTIKSGLLTASATVFIDTASAPAKVSLQDVKINKPTKITIKQEEQYSVPENITDTITYSPEGTSAHIEVTENFVLQDKSSNILSAEIKDDFDENGVILDQKYVELVFLSGIEINKLRGGLNVVSFDKETHYLSGEYEEYIPTEINVSFYGETLTLNLEDETVKIGDGQHVYSFSGNELMQTSNQIITNNYYGISIMASIKDDGGYSYFPIYAQPADVLEGDIFSYNGEKGLCVIVDGRKTIRAITDGEWSTLAGRLQTIFVTRISTQQIQETAKKIINSWKEGRETAIIRCAINNYEEKKEIEASIKPLNKYLPAGGQTYFNGSFGLGIPQDKILSAFIQINGVYYEVKNISISSGFFSGFVDGSFDWDTEKFYTFKITYKELPIDISSPKMSFEIGDIVEPYIMAANGKDKPMSLTKDGETKQFVVIGKRIIFDGMVQQEITIQEIYQTE